VPQRGTDFSTFIDPRGSPVYLRLFSLREYEGESIGRISDVTLSAAFGVANRDEESTARVFAGSPKEF
jgi:hypothetical protein